MWNWRTKLTKDWVGVNVYRSDGVDSQYVRITKAPLAVMDTLYTDSVPAPGSYYYYVASVDKAGNEGHSFKTYADVADIFTPARVGGITIQSDTGKIIISWNASKEKDLAGYQLYRRSDSGNDESFALMNASPVIGTTYTDTLAKNIRSSICYKIVAVDTALNRGEYSDVACAKMPDIQPPVQPYIKKISNKNGLVMEWIPNKDEDLMGYDLYRCSLKDSTLVMDKANSSLIGKDKISFSDSLAKQGEILLFPDRI